MKNFELLHDVFTNIEVDFPASKAQAIMESKSGVIKKLLYQIRSTLEKKGMNLEALSLKKCNDNKFTSSEPPPGDVLIYENRKEDPRVYQARPQNLHGSVTG
jgi:hypothetical protein